MADILGPGSTVGILGGGQLGRMLAIAAAQMGLHAHIYCPEDNPPAGEVAAKKAMEHGLRQVDVYVNGPGSGREAAVRALQSVGLRVNLIRDVTPIPHNGCRPPKRRRV